MKFFSLATGGFYDDGFHLDGMPPDALPITEAEFVTLHAGLAAGQRIENQGGHLVLVDVPVVIERGQVAAERDRRLRGGATFAGRPFQTDILSMLRMSSATTLALGAIIAGKQPGDLRWHGGPTDFTFTTTDNIEVPMDAQTMMAFGTTMALREKAHINAAKALVAMVPIPTDYTSNAYWPA